MSAEENQQRLKGRYVTYVCRIDDPVKWAERNPMTTHQLNGCVVVGLSCGDLMAYSDALEQLIDDDRDHEQRAAYAAHCHPGPRRIVDTPRVDIAPKAKGV